MSLISAAALIFTQEALFSVSAENDETDPDLQTETDERYCDESEVKNQIILKESFEEGTGNWSSVFTADIKTDKKHYHSGSSSLVCSDRKINFNGPLLNLSKYIKKECAYTFSVYAYHESDKPELLKYTLGYTDSVGEKNYLELETKEVPPGEWVELRQSVHFPKNDDVSFPFIYVETVNDYLGALYIDDVTIKGEEPSDANSSLVSGIKRKFDFEEDNNQWSTRGQSRIIRTDQPRHSGSYAICCAERESSWDGAVKDLDMISRDEKYIISAYVYYEDVEGEEPLDDEHYFSLSTEYNENGSTCYTHIATKKVKKGKWTKISGKFTFTDSMNSVKLYVETNKPEELEREKLAASDPEKAAEYVIPAITPSDVMEYYLDDVSLVKEAKAKSTNKTIIIILIIAIIFIIFVIIILKKKSGLSKSKDRNNLLVNAMDEMTQTLNAETFDEKVKLISKDPELCKSVFISICDLNGLDNINKIHGKKKGDEAIIRCANILLHSAGQKGVVYRVTADKFVCISKSSIEETVKEQIAKESSTDQGYTFSVASGFAHFDKLVDQDPPNIGAIISRADNELFLNKQILKKQSFENL